MAYTHSKYEFLMTPTNASATATGEVGIRFTPGFVPHYIRAVGVIPTTSGAVYGSLQVDVKHLDLASGSTASDVCNIYGVASDKPGHVIYKDGLDVLISPGETAYVNVTSVATTTAANFKTVLYVEPKWEQPTNDTDMRVTT